MRLAPGALAVSLATLALAPAARGAERERTKVDCTIQVDAGDLAAQGKDLVVEPGRKVHQALALNGDVVLRRGAVADEVAALGGSVIVEAGAVAGKVLAVGGDVRIEAGGRVTGDATAFGGRLRIDPAAAVGGDHNELDLTINGTELGKRIREEIKSRGLCRVERKT